MPREGLWKVLGQYGCPAKFITLVKALHNEMQVHEAEGNYISKEFAVTNGVKPDYVFAPTLFSQRKAGATPLCDMLHILSNFA